jgi:hypothetical protein
MYTDEMAKELKKSAGKKWRPSNGTEGIMFKEKFCYRCIKDDDPENPCLIIGRSMAFNVDEPEYPKEWQIGPDGQPICTEFKLK